jgi:hypothetical protein
MSTTQSTATLSVARSYLAAAASGNKVVFGGGYNAGYIANAAVDIYDVVANTWTTVTLSLARASLAAAASGDKVVFGGGIGASNSNRVDIYDVVANTWTTATLSLDQKLT